MIQLLNASLQHTKLLLIKIVII